MSLKSKSIIKGAFLLGLLGFLFAILFLIKGIGMLESHSGKTPEVPIIRLALGDSFENFVNQSSYSFENRQLSTVDAVSASTPFIFEYSRTGGEFNLPAGIYCAASVDNGHITHVTVSPHLNYLSLNNALALVQEISNRLLASKWKLVKQNNFPATFRLDTTQAFNMQAWVFGDDELNIQIEKQWDKNESLPELSKRNEDLYVVSVKIDNDKISSLYPGVLNK